MGSGDDTDYTERMPKVSAGLVMYRMRGGEIEVLLVHPGGPFWAKKDAGAWFIPKGEVKPHEDLFSAAKREFLEETGMKARGQIPGAGQRETQKRENGYGMGV